MKPWFLLGVFATVLILVRLVLLDPIVLNLTDSWNAMCKGNIDFLAFPVEVGPIVAGKPSEHIQLNRSSYAYRAILQRTGLQSSNSPKIYVDADEPSTPFPLRNVKAALASQSYSLTDLTNARITDTTFGIECGSDEWWRVQYPHTEPAIWEAIRDETQDPHAKSCSYLRKKGWCQSSSRASAITRFFCPQTCGYKFASDGGLVYNSGQDGVPYHCQKTLGFGLQVLPCVDKTLPDAQSAFDYFVDGIEHKFAGVFRALSGGNSTHDQVNVQKLRELAKQGCPWLYPDNDPSKWIHHVDFHTNGLSYHLSAILCDIAWKEIFGEYFTARIHLCPVACGCTTTVASKYVQDGKNWSVYIGMTEECPQSCFPENIRGEPFPVDTFNLLLETLGK